MNKEELQARSLKFSVDIRVICAVVRRLEGGRTPAEQLLACSASAASNYRAACRGRSRAEFISKLGTVVEESDESVYWLEYIEKSGLMSANQLEVYLDEARQLRAIFAASYGTARSNNRKGNRKPRRWTPN
jgi:four helix bundle protein